MSQLLPAQKRLLKIPYTETFGNHQLKYIAAVCRKYLLIQHLELFLVREHEV